MKILILGGTRFLGKTLAYLLSNNHQLTVLSRNPLSIHGVRRLIMDRTQGLLHLQGEEFDLGIDFLAYDETGLDSLSTICQRILVISSTWLPLWHGVSADAPIGKSEISDSLFLPEITRNYLHGKRKMEAILPKFWKDQDWCILRLPILIGIEDHTRRLVHYILRLKQNSPIFLVDGGRNPVHLLSVDRIAAAVKCLVENQQLWTPGYIEGLVAPIQLRNLIGLLAAEMRVKAIEVEVSVDVLSKYFPDYLQYEPYWRERSLELTDKNIFKITNIDADIPQNLISHLVNTASLLPMDQKRIDMERTFFEEQLC